MLYLAAYGLSFLLGLGIVLRPGVILASLIFRPVFVAMMLLLVAGALAALPSGAADNMPALAAGGLAAGTGGLLGFKLRRLTRGGL